MMSFLHQSDLLHQSNLVVEEPLFSNLPSTIPGGDGAKFDVEALSGRLNYLAVGCFHLSFHRAVEVGDRASMIPLLEKDLVWPIYQMIVGKSLEEFYSLQVMVLASPRRFGLTRPVNGYVLGMTLSEGLPQWAFGSSVPSVVQGLHQVREVFYNLRHRRSGCSDFVLKTVEISFIVDETPNVF